MDNYPSFQEQLRPCLNCGYQMQGSYCGNCGQEAKDLRRPFFKLSLEAIQSLLELDGRAFRTLFCLLFKPAFLSREYFSGRRASYTPPLRLFLIISVSFFLLVSLYTSIQSIDEVLRGEPAEVAVEAPLLDNDTVGAIDSEQDSGEIDESSLENIERFVNDIHLPFLSEQTNENLRTAMKAQAETNLNTLLEDPADFASGYLEYITVFTLLMMPLLALIQKVLYLRTGHYYVEHLVLTLHNHAFIILAIFINIIFDIIEEEQIAIISSLFAWAGTAVFIWGWTYLFLSLKNYFQQGYAITLLKFLLTTLLYSTTFGLGLAIFFGILFFLF